MGLGGPWGSTFFTLVIWDIFQCFLGVGKIVMEEQKFTSIYHIIYHLCNKQMNPNELKSSCECKYNCKLHLQWEGGPGLGDQPSSARPHTLRPRENITRLISSVISSLHHWRILGPPEPGHPLLCGEETMDEPWMKEMVGEATGKFFLSMVVSFTWSSYSPSCSKE